MVRYRTGSTAPSGRPELTDVIGHVTSAGPDAVVVRHRDGHLVEVRTADILTWKPVPEPPAR